MSELLADQRYILKGVASFWRIGQMIFRGNMRKVGGDGISAVDNMGLGVCNRVVGQYQ